MKKKVEYWNGTELRNTKSKYLMSLGERSNGKSYWIKHDVLKQCIAKGEEFGIIRRTELELKKVEIEQYFEDIDYSKLDFDCNHITTKGRVIFLAKTDEDTGKVTLIKKIGYTFALSKSSSYKSGAYPKVNQLIFEEFISENGYYLNRENFLLQSIVSTVARRREIRVWLIGNKISRLCPYFFEWGLSNIPKQKNDTIETYIHTDEDGEEVRISVEMCDTLSVNTMFFGKSKKYVSDGEWLTDSYDKLPKQYEEYECIYFMIIEYNDTRYKVEYLLDEYVEMIYIKPFTKRELKNDTRILSNIQYHTPYYSYGIKAMNEVEIIMLDIISNGLVYYSDNLTGTEFNETMKKMRKL